MINLMDILPTVKITTVIFHKSFASSNGPTPGPAHLHYKQSCQLGKMLSRQGYCRVINSTERFKSYRLREDVMFAVPALGDKGAKDYRTFRQ